MEIISKDSWCQKGKSYKTEIGEVIMPIVDTLEEKELAEKKAAEHAARTHAALAALERLRKLTENLPPVDAVALIREMRDAASPRFE